MQTSAVIWKYLGTLAGLERRWLRRSSSTMHNIASSSRLAILAQSSPRLLTYFQNTALVQRRGRRICAPKPPGREFWNERLIFRDDLIRKHAVGVVFGFLHNIGLFSILFNNLLIQGNRT